MRETIRAASCAALLLNLQINDHWHLNVSSGTSLFLKTVWFYDKCMLTGSIVGEREKGMRLGKVRKSELILLHQAHAYDAAKPLHGCIALAVATVDEFLSKNLNIHCNNA